MKKKVFSLALALALCLGLTVPAFATAPFTYDKEDSLVRVTNVLKYEEKELEYAEEKGLSFTCAAPASFTPGNIFDRSEGKVEAYAIKMPEWANLTIDNYAEFFDYAVDEDGGNEITASDGESIILTESGCYIVWVVTSTATGNSSYRACLVNVQPATATTPTDPDSRVYQVSGWAAERVALAMKTGLAPDGLGSDYRVDITRAQFAATAVKLYEAMSGKKAEATGESSFTDTTDPVILQAADLGFVSGVGEGKFDPTALVTREQAAVMLSSVYAKLGGEIPAVEATSFADNDSVSGWAKNAVAFMNGKSIITGVGDNNFAPKGQASIEQALLISLKMFEELK